ncbi:SMP-30/gluconolactonase/LRE family protein [Rubripirellula sp.]|nr:SMP-30/gluconolactonase/LRE family protein [Rubripirellula sp.]MDB4338697.1 SMP-30/gluconolactonase/LRE family protein [Rubripirellula sp.]
MAKLVVAIVVLSMGTLGTAQSVVDRNHDMELIRSDFGLADGPSWTGSSLIVPDVKGDRIFRYSPKKDEWKVVFENAGRISASFYNHGRVFLSDNGETSLCFLDGNKKRLISSLVSPESNLAGKQKVSRPNDLVVDQHGGVYLTMTSLGKVFYVSTDGEVSVAVDGIETPNGITLSPDEQTLYVASFVPKKIWSYEVVSAGKTSSGKVLAEMDQGPERGADGMAIDRAGNLYCAGPTAVWIWAPDGTLLEKIDCPSKPINCTFGDQDMRTLYITALDGLYRQRMKVSGCSPRPINQELKPIAEAKVFSQPGAPSTKLPASIEARWNVVYSTDGQREMLADLFFPSLNTNGQARPALIVVHGGGWHSGDKTKFQALSIRLAQCGYFVAAIEYRLADEAAFPTAIEDCFASVRFLRANAKQFGIDPTKIGAVGGSAGGHLVGLMAAGASNPALLGSRDNMDQGSGLQAAIVMAGPMEMLTGSVAERSRNAPKESNANRWLRATVDEDASLYRAADAFAQISVETCPLLFMVGEHDLPTRNQPSRDKLSSLGVDTGVMIYEGGKHGCWNRLPWLPEMVGDMDLFFQKQLN